MNCKKNKKAYIQKCKKIESKILITLFSCLTIFLPCNFSLYAQTNAEQVVTIGKNVLSMEDYMLAIQYFNLAIKAKPYMADPYFYRGLAKLYLDDYQGAEEDVTLAIERNAFKPEAYKLRGFVRQLAGKDSLALLDYDKGLSFNPTDKYFLYYKGIALTDMEQYDKAEDTFLQLLREYPRFEEGLTAFSKLNLERGDTVAALENVEKAISINKSQINPYLVKAEIEWERKNWQKAGEALDAAIRLKPEEGNLYVNRAFVRYNDDDFQGAMDDYNYALILNPSNVSALFNRGLLRYEVKSLEKSKEDFSKVLEIEPDNFHATYNRGLVELELNENKEALADFKKITEKYPRFYPVYYAMGEAERNIGDMRKAMQYVRYADELVEKYVQNPEINKLDRPVIAAAQSNNRKGGEQEENEEEIMDKFNRLVTVSHGTSEQLAYNDLIKGRVQDRDVEIAALPLFAVTFSNGPQTLKSTSNYFRELDDLNHLHLINETLYLSEGMNSDSKSDLSSLFSEASQLENITLREGARPIDYLAYGVASLMLKNYQASLEALDKAISYDNKFTVAYMARGYAKYETAVSEKKRMDNQGENSDFYDRKLYDSLLQEAIEDFDMALSLNPRLTYALFNKGNIYYQVKDFGEARRNYDKALIIDPTFGEAYFNRGLALLQQGDKNAAFESLSKAGEAGIVESYNILKRMRN